MPIDTLRDVNLPSRNFWQELVDAATELSRKAPTSHKLEVRQTLANVLTSLTHKERAYLSSPSKTKLKQLINLKKPLDSSRINRAFAELIATGAGAQYPLQNVDVVSLEAHSLKLSEILIHDIYMQAAFGDAIYTGLTQAQSRIVSGLCEKVIGINLAGEGYEVVSAYCSSVEDAIAVSLASLILAMLFAAWLMRSLEAFNTVREETWLCGIPITGYKPDSNNLVTVVLAVGDRPV